MLRFLRIGLATLGTALVLAAAIATIVLQTRRGEGLTRKEECQLHAEEVCTSLRPLCTRYARARARALGLPQPTTVHLPDCGAYDDCVAEDRYWCLHPEG